MKGIVFREFIDLVEDKFGYKMVDEIITESNLESRGVYTAIGTYDYSEMLQLVTNLSHKTDIDVQVLVKIFGNFLAVRFSEMYPDFFKEAKSCFPFLHSIENHIHVQVKKLYPDADLPTFDTEVVNENKMIMIYSSERGLYSLAEGLIEGSANYYNEKITISSEDLSEGTGRKVKFILTKI